MAPTHHAAQQASGLSYASTLRPLPLAAKYLPKKRGMAQAHPFAAQQGSGPRCAANLWPPAFHSAAKRRHQITCMLLSRHQAYAAVTTLWPPACDSGTFFKKKRDSTDPPPHAAQQDLDLSCVATFRPAAFNSSACSERRQAAPTRLYAYQQASGPNLHSLAAALLSTAPFKIRGMAPTHPLAAQ